jgi:hypothetical protein
MKMLKTEIKRYADSEYTFSHIPQEKPSDSYPPDYFIDKYLWFISEVFLDPSNAQEFFFQTMTLKNVLNLNILLSLDYQMR